MLRTLTIVSGLAAAAVFSPATVSAGALPPAAPARVESSSVQPVQFWDIRRCRAWRRECADRWGWRTARWHRCLARHGCERHRYGDRWD